MTEIITDYLDAKQLADRLTALELRSTSELARLEQERDKAREDLEEETKFHHRTHIELIQTQCKLLDMEMQRDEARDAILGWENKWKCAVDMAARAELERDEARELAQQMSESNQVLQAEVRDYRKKEKANPFYKY